MFTTFSLAVILDCTVRIVLGTALGALIGLERQLRARSAGIRTNALVALGSTLFVLVSEMAVAGGSSGDPTRVAAQVASGIGFLGAGAILKHGFDKSYSDYGCPYVQENCDMELPSGNISFSTINIVRLGIECMNIEDKEQRIAR